MKQFLWTTIVLFSLALLAGQILVHFRFVDMILGFALTFAAIKFLREFYDLDCPPEDWIDNLETTIFVLLLAVVISVFLLGLLTALAIY